jgi:hypothetical protein
MTRRFVFIAVPLTALTVLATFSVVRYAQSNHAFNEVIPSDSVTPSGGESDFRDLPRQLLSKEVSASLDKKVEGLGLSPKDHQAIRELILRVAETYANPTEESYIALRNSMGVPVDPEREQSNLQMWVAGAARLQQARLDVSRFRLLSADDELNQLSPWMGLNRPAGLPNDVDVRLHTGPHIRFLVPGVLPGGNDRQMAGFVLFGFSKHQDGRWLLTETGFAGFRTGTPIRGFFP